MALQSFPPPVDLSNLQCFFIGHPIAGGYSLCVTLTEDENQVIFTGTNQRRTSQNWRVYF